MPCRLSCSSSERIRVLASPSRCFRSTTCADCDGDSVVRAAVACTPTVRPPFDSSAAMCAGSVRAPAVRTAAAGALMAVDVSAPAVLVCNSYTRIHATVSRSATMCVWGVGVYPIPYTI